MKTTKKIKVIKRQNVVLPTAEAPLQTNRPGARSNKNVERELAERVSSWIREQREDKRAEESRNFQKLFSSEISAL